MRRRRQHGSRGRTPANTRRSTIWRIVLARRTPARRATLCSRAAPVDDRVHGGPRRDPEPTATRTAASPTARGLRRPMAEPQRTLLLVKPDGVQRQLVGRVLTRFEERGLKLVGLKLVQVDRALAEEPLRGPPREAVLRGARRLHHVGAARRRGARGPQRDRDRPRDERRHPPARGRARARSAATSRSRRRRTWSTRRTAPENAAAELALWFKPEELLSYEREIDRWVLAPEE